MWLISAAVDTDIDMKGLHKHLSLRSGNLRFADADYLKKHLGCIKGTTNFYAIVNDTESAVNFLIDKKLTQAEWISSHPFEKTSTTAIN